MQPCSYQLSGRIRANAGPCCVSAAAAARPLIFRACSLSTRNASNECHETRFFRLGAGRRTDAQRPYTGVQISSVPVSDEMFSCYFLFCVCADIAHLSAYSRPQNAAVESQVRPALDNLVDDADRDVRYFSRKAMQAVSTMG